MKICFTFIFNTLSPLCVILKCENKLCFVQKKKKFKIPKCFAEKYDYVGQLLKPGEVPHDYTDTEDENPEKSEKSEAEKKTD